MEKRQEDVNRLDLVTSLALGKIAHFEDLIALTTIQAEELLTDIKSKNYLV